MYNFNTDNYEMKREIINFSDKLLEKSNICYTFDYLKVFILLSFVLLVLVID